MTRKKRIIWGVILVGGVCLVAYVNDYRVKLYTGYCFEEKRYLTDKELQNSAIRFLIQHRAQDSLLSDEPSTSSYISDLRLPDYDSVEEFRERNPDCCKPIVTKKPSEHNYSFWADEGEGFEFHTGLHEENILAFTSSYRTTFTINACGEVNYASDNKRKYNSRIEILERR